MTALTPADKLKWLRGRRIATTLKTAGGEELNQEGSIHELPLSSGMTGVIDDFSREHAEICDLLDQLVYDLAHRRPLARLPEVCSKILMHCSLETGVLIPAIAELDGGDDLLRETGLKFAVVSSLIKQLSCVIVSVDDVARLLDELRQCVVSHIASAEETGGIMERARQMKLDWVLIEHRLVARRAELDDQQRQRNARLTGDD